ncbi:baseplate J/gp47 family protein [Cohnella abietis]|uniref:Uncharacterized protein n=1 Tax=Cohnella abietis TaxID=2507935 RepID=A0A3T1D332_9BACL|nr:baseplate J/gp47 family protein [Cohnella abietis]BBI32494.1 hypothetical protein KCTCHS21_18930 [Cohnella abietis]
MSSVILSQMLAAIPETYDKRPGSFIYDSLAPVADQLAQTDTRLESVASELSIEHLSGPELAQRVRERTGIELKAATRAVGTVLLTGTGEIHPGDLFETAGGVQFRATEAKAITLSGYASIEAVVSGTSGNVAAETIILFPVTLAGFTAVINPQSTHGGFEQESDADLLMRYYERIRTPSTSGNKAHYLNWSKEVPGVGDARVIPLWSGPNTVKVIIIDANRQPAFPQLVTDVQNHIDPGGTGLGDGVAPIGAHTTVVSAAPVAINVSVKIVPDVGYDDAHIIDSLIKHLSSIAFVEDIVSYARAGAAILASPGVADYSNLLINGGSINVPIAYSQVAVLGAVVIDVH